MVKLNAGVDNINVIADAARRGGADGLIFINTLKMYNNMSAGPACAFCRSQMTSFVVKNPEIYSLVSEHCIM
jgi:dihydroorotate dehydrogenase